MIQKIEHPDTPRVETGAVQFGEDWPGLFIRGDEAISLALRIGLLLDWVKLQPNCGYLVFETEALKDIRETILNEVVVK